MAPLCPQALSARNAAQPASARNAAQPASARIVARPASARNEAQPASARNVAQPTRATPLLGWRVRAICLCVLEVPGQGLKAHLQSYATASDCRCAHEVRGRIRGKHTGAASTQERLPARQRSQKDTARQKSIRACKGWRPAKQCTKNTVLRVSRKC